MKEMIQIIGHLGADATVNKTKGKKQAINFSLAVTTKYKDGKGVNQEKTNWYSCTKFEKEDASLAVVQYMVKGAQIGVVGKPELNIFQKKDGTTDANIQVLVRELNLLGTK